MNKLHQYLVLIILNLVFLNSSYAVEIITTINNFKVFYCGNEIRDPEITPLKTESYKLDYCDEKLRLNVKHYNTEDNGLSERCASKSVYRLISQVEKTDSKGFCNTPEVRWYCDPVGVVIKNKLPKDTFVCPEIKTVINAITPGVKKLQKLDVTTIGGQRQCGCCCNNNADSTIVKDITEYNGIKYEYDSYSGYYIPVEPVE